MQTDKNMKKKILIISAVVLAVLHLVYAFGEYYYNYISGDFTKEILCEILFYLLNGISVVLIYFRFGVAVSAYRRFPAQRAFSFGLLCGISFLVGRVLEIFVYAISFSGFADGAAAYILSALLSLLIDLIILALIILLSQLKKLSNAHIKYTAIICSAINLATAMVQAVFYTDFSSVDATVIFLDYIRPVIGAVIGVFIIILTDKILFAKRDEVEE